MIVPVIKFNDPDFLPCLNGMRTLVVCIQLQETARLTDCGKEVSVPCLDAGLLRYRV